MNGNVVLVGIGSLLLTATRPPEYNIHSRNRKAARQAMGKPNGPYAQTASGAVSQDIARAPVVQRAVQVTARSGV